MANPDATNTGIDPDLDTRFAHLTMSAPPVDTATAHDTTTPSFWPTQDETLSSQPTTIYQGTINPPALTDTVLAVQINAHPSSFDYGQHTHDPANQAHWTPGNNPPQAGPSSAPTDPNRPFVCHYEGCHNSYRRQCDLEYVLNPASIPRCVFTS
jgi:hypothetical protein